MNYEVTVTITVHVEAVSQEEAYHLIAASINEHGLPVLDYEDGIIVADCDED